MKIALIGYGKMGKEIENLAVENNMIITAKIHPGASDPSYRKITSDNISDADVCIEFTHPSVAFNNIQKLVELNKNIVVGTTGWYNHLPTVKDLVNKQGTALIWGENFSLGISLFLKIVENAAQLISQFPEYDPGGYEIHHRQKKDAPSGTSSLLTKSLMKHYLEKNSIHSDSSSQIQENEIHFSSLRIGAATGIHSVLFDSEWDTITLTHNAKNRKCFAKGALTAARWLIDKKGLHHIGDIF